MIITCPSCSTRYMAETSAFLPDGRTVRCSFCQHTWFQGPPVDSSLHAVADASAGGMEFLGSRSVADGRMSGKQLVGHLAGWAVYCLALVGVVTSLYTYRVELVRLWPKAAVMYSSLGIPVNTRGLAFVNTVYAQFEDDGMDVLAISGEIENITAQDLMVPPIRVSLRDAQQREIYDWVFSTDTASLPSRNKSQFETRLGNPPADARDLVVTFVQADEL